MYYIVFNIESPDIPLDGVSLLPLFDETISQRVPTQPLYFHQRWGKLRYSAIEWPYKLNAFGEIGKLKYDVYNIKTDPYEIEDIKNTIDYSGMVSRLNEWIASVNESRISGKHDVKSNK